MTSAVRTFLYVLACAVLASLASHALRRLTSAYEISTALAHLLYLAGLAWCVARDRKVAASPLPAVVATVAAVGLLAALAVLGAVIHTRFPLAGAVLMESMTLGYYPPGADVPFEIGGLVWGLSMLALTGAALMAGGVFRQRRGVATER